MCQQRETNQCHKFSVVVNELKSAETVPHKTAGMTFVNALINCNPDLAQRCRIRNQMIGQFFNQCVSVGLQLNSVYVCSCTCVF